MPYSMISDHHFSLTACKIQPLSSELQDRKDFQHSHGKYDSTQSPKPTYNAHTQNQELKRGTLDRYLHCGML
jgi:hypothetical protein